MGLHGNEPDKVVTGDDVIILRKGKESIVRVNSLWTENGKNFLEAREYVYPDQADDITEPFGKYELYERDVKHTVKLPIDCIKRTVDLWYPEASLSFTDLDRTVTQPTRQYYCRRYISDSGQQLPLVHQSHEPCPWAT